MEKIISIQKNIRGSKALLFSYFTKADLLTKWLTNKADVDLGVGGKYELFWVPEIPEDNSTIGCKILAFKENYFLHFEWKGPVQFKEVMNTPPLTQVTVIVHEDHITLLHTGFKYEPERRYFENAWTNALDKLSEIL